MIPLEVILREKWYNTNYCRTIQQNTIVFKVFGEIPLFWNSILWKSSSVYNSILVILSFMCVLPR